jgi:hypothetical protein
MRTCVPLALIIPSLLVMPVLDDALCFTSLALCSALSLARQAVSPALRHGLCRTVHASCPVRLLVLMTSATTLLRVFTTAESFVVFMDPLFLYIFLPFLIIF